MKKVYICSPLRGKTDDEIKANIEFARRYCREATMQHYIPMASHIYFTQFLDDNNEDERNLGIDMGKEWLKDCDRVWVCGERISAGMRAEIALAEMLGIPIIYKK